MEIIIKESKEITNPQLNARLNNVSELVIDSKHNQKKIADQLGRIVSEKMYESDFDSLKGFCKYIGLGQATMSQYKTFFERVDSSLVYDCLPEDDYSYTQIMEAIKIIDELDIEVLTGDILQERGIYPSMSCKEIRKVVNALLEDSEDIEESEESEEIEEIEESEESEESGDDEIVESFIDYLNGMETGIVIDDFDVKMFKNIASYLKGAIKWQKANICVLGICIRLLA